MWDLHETKLFVTSLCVELTIQNFTELRGISRVTLQFWNPGYVKSNITSLESCNCVLQSKRVRNGKNRYIWTYSVLALCCQCQNVPTPVLLQEWWMWRLMVVQTISVHILVKKKQSLSFKQNVGTDFGLKCPCRHFIYQRHGNLLGPSTDCMETCDWVFCEAWQENCQANHDQGCDCLFAQKYMYSGH